MSAVFVHFTSRRFYDSRIFNFAYMDSPYNPGRDPDSRSELDFRRRVTIAWNWRLENKYDGNRFLTTLGRLVQSRFREKLSPASGMKGEQISQKTLPRTGCKEIRRFRKKNHALERRVREISEMGGQKMGSITRPRYSGSTMYITHIPIYLRKLLTGPIFTNVDEFWSQNGEVITYKGNCGTKLIIHTKTSVVTLGMDRKFLSTIFNAYDQSNQMKLKLCW